MIAQAAGDTARCPILAESAVQFWTTRVAVPKTYFFSKNSGIIQDKGEKKTFDPNKECFLLTLEIPVKKKELDGFKLSSEILYSRVFVTLSDPSEWVIDLVCIYIYTYVLYVYIYTYAY